MQKTGDRICELPKVSAFEHLTSAGAAGTVERLTCQFLQVP